MGFDIWPASREGGVPFEIRSKLQEKANPWGEIRKTFIQHLGVS